MNADIVEKVSVPSLPNISGYNFLLRLIDEKDIFEHSPEYGPFSKQNNSNTRIIRFVLKKERVGFIGAGSVIFTQEKQPWIFTESIEFKLHCTQSIPSLEKPEKDWCGYNILVIKWFANTSNHSGINYTLSDKEITSPSTNYALKIIEKVRKLFERKI